MGRTRIDIGLRNLFYSFGATRRGGGCLWRLRRRWLGGASKALVCRSRVETLLDDWVASSLHDGPKPAGGGVEPPPRVRDGGGERRDSSFFSASSGFPFRLEDPPS